MNKKIYKKVGLILLAFVILVILAGISAYAAQQHTYYGYAAEEGNSNKLVEDGTTVTACVYKASSSYWYNQSTVVNNSYGGDYNYLIVINPPDSPVLADCPIFWYIGNENTTNDSGFKNLGTNWPFPPFQSSFWNLTINDEPQLTDNTNRTNGTTGDLFYFNVTVIDYIDSGEELTINVSWSHNGSSGNKTLTNLVGNYFIGSITLGHNISDMVYTVWANDTSGNMNSSGPHSVTVTDNDPPVSSLEITEPLHPNGVFNNSNITSSSLIFINASDNIGSYYINYRIWNSTYGWSSLNTGPADNGINFSLIEEGKNYVEYYANDSAGNNETTRNITLWVDDSAPTTSLTVNEQVHPSSSDGCNVTSSTLMTLSASDSPVDHNCGVSSTCYRFWNGSSGWTSWTSYGSAFSLGSDEGLYYLEFNSTDNLSNAEVSNNWSIWVDNTAPTTTLSIGSPNHTSGIDGCNVTSSTVFTLAGSDSPSNGSGVAFSWYTDNDVYHLYTTAFTLSGEGQHNLTYGSQDNLTTNETANTISVWVDDTAPTASLTINDPNHPSSINGTNITSSTTLNITSTDNPGHNSGVAFSWYTDNGVYHLFTTNFTLSGEGVHYIVFGSQDNLGTNASSGNWSVWVDDSAPTTSLTVNEQVHPSSSDGCNVTSSTLMTLSASDSPVDHNCGVSSTCYRFWNGSSGWTSWTSYGSAFSLGSDEGLYYLEFNSTDNLSNAEVSNNWSIWVDNTAPSSIINNQTAGYYLYNQNSSNLTITATVNISSETNGSGLRNVSLYYYYNNATNAINKTYENWGSATYFNVNTTPWLNLSSVSWSFNFPDGQGYYRYYSLAVDNLSNSETSLSLNNTNGTECLYNNTPPNEPTRIGPTGTSVSTSANLEWNCTDPDVGDTLTYDVYFGTDSTPDATEKVASNQTAKIYTPTLSSGTTYYWKIVAWDNHNASNTSSVWSFKTQSGGGGGGSGSSSGGDLTGPTEPGNVRCTSASNDNTPSFAWDASTDSSSNVAGYYVKIDNGDETSIGDVLTYNWPDTLADGTYVFYVRARDDSSNQNYGNNGSCSFTIDTSGGTSTNKAPVADAGGPYTGLTYQNKTFNGSGSTDSDGTIENYTWDFGDGNYSYGITPIHSYNQAGIYNVSLTITDNDGGTDVNITSINISLDTDADGWSDEIEESYNTDINDPNDGPLDTNNDGIPDEDSPDGKYKGSDDDDGDGIPDEVEEELGSDPKNSSGIFILPEVEGEEGKTYYLVDTDGDGIYDKIYCSENENVKIEHIAGTNKYKIDFDGDREWDYTYDSVSGEIVIIEPEEEPGLIIPAWLLIVLLIVIIIVIIITAMFKTGYLYIEEESSKSKKPVVPPQKPKTKEKTDKKETKTSSKNSKSAKKKK